MAVDLFSRWFLIREIITEQKTGTLIMQMGQHYIQWSLNSGNLLYVSATNSDLWLVHHLFNKGGELKQEDVVAAEAGINEKYSIAYLLIRQRDIEPELVRQLVHEHWISISNFLLQSSTRLVWTDRQMIPKRYFMDLTFPFSDLILSLERTSIEIRSAIEFGDEHLTSYKLKNISGLEKILLPKEKRIVHYLKTSAPMKEILLEPEMDQFTCYRVVFLLWLAGQLHLNSKQERERRVDQPSLMARLKSVPAEWIFPLVFGILLGLLLAPKDEPPPEQHRFHQEGLEEAVPNPAWSTPTSK